MHRRGSTSPVSGPPWVRWCGRRAPGEYIVELAPSPQVVAAVTAWLAERDIPLADLRAGRKRLEDVYLALTAETSVAAAARLARRGTATKQ